MKRNIIFLLFLSFLSTFFETSCLTGLSNIKANAVVVQSNGQIVVAGGATVLDVKQGIIARYNTDGSFDAAFSGGVVTKAVGQDAEFKDVIEQADGKLVVVGSATLSTSPQLFAVRFNVDGTVDTNFGSQGIYSSVLGISSSANGVAQQADGKLVITGFADATNGSKRIMTLRLTTTGSLDTNFGTNGVTFTQVGSIATANAISIQGDGKIIAAGNGFNTFLALRYLNTGALDIPYGNNGVSTTAFGTYAAGVNAIVIQPDGKAILGGYTDSSFGLIRLTTGINPGVLDAGFGSGGKVTTPFTSTSAAVFGLALQSDGKILVAGYKDNQIALARYTTTGVLDTTYGTNGIVTLAEGNVSRALDGAIQPSDNKLVIAGQMDANPLLMRFTTTGIIDTDFGIVSSPESCSNSLCAYGQVYNVSEIDVAANAPVTFDSNGLLINISHDLNSSEIVIGQAGTYSVEYIIEVNGNSLFELRLNDVSVPVSKYLSPNTSVTVGRAIFAANDQDVITLVNLTEFDQPLVPGGINASITIEKIA